MRKVILFNFMSLDGYFSGPNGELDWYSVSEEHNEYALEQISSSDLLIFGRVTYQLMADFWPTEQARASDPVFFELMSEIPKIVFSKTLKSADWVHTSLCKTDAEDEVRRLKEFPGKNMAVLGSAELASSLIRAGLVDEFQVIVCPVILGGGKPLFYGLQPPTALQLVESRQFRDGKMLLVYQLNSSGHDRDLS